MDQGETNPVLRRIYSTIYADDGVTLSTTAAVAPPSGAVMTTVNGAAFVNAPGSLVHVGAGVYYYEATSGEVAVSGFLSVKYERAGFTTTHFWTNVGDLWLVGELDTALLRLPFTIYDDVNEPPLLATGATVTTASQLTTSTNGAVFVNAAGSLTEVGHGLYFYQGVTSDTLPGVLLVKFLKSGFLIAITQTPVSVPVGSGSTPGIILNLSPTDGALLNVDPRIARWMPIIATIRMTTDEKLYVFTQIGSLRWTIYDGTTGITSPFFADHTTVTHLGGDDFAISVLPNGGWWRSNIDIRFISGTELLLDGGGT